MKPRTRDLRVSDHDPRRRDRGYIPSLARRSPCSASRSSTGPCMPTAPSQAAHRCCPRPGNRGDCGGRGVRALAKLDSVATPVAVGVTLARVGVVAADLVAVGQAVAVGVSQTRVRCGNGRLRRRHQGRRGRCRLARVGLVAADLGAVVQAVAVGVAPARIGVVAADFGAVVRPSRSVSARRGLVW